MTRRSFLSGTILALVSGGAVATTSSAQKLTRKTFPDKSGSIGLAPGWKIIDAANGAVDASGPNGAAISLGVPVSVVTRGVERLYPDIPGNALFPGSARVDFTDPVRAGLDMLAFRNAQARAQGTGGMLKVKKILAVESVPTPNGKGAYVRYTAETGGKTIEAFGLYAILPIDNVQGMFYYSVVAAPTATYKKALPTMISMWQSWSLSNATVRQRLVSAQKALAEVDVKGTVESVLAERRRVAEEAARHYSEYLRQ